MSDLTPEELSHQLTIMHFELVKLWRDDGPGAVWDMLETANRRTLMALIMAQVGSESTLD